MKAGLFIVTHAKDAQFLGPCARSISKLASGFERVLIVAPQDDVPAITAAAPALDVRGYVDCPGKSFLYHMVQKCRADIWMPECDTIFHMDSDCVFTEPSRPEDWLINDKPLMCYRKFSDYLEGSVSPEASRNVMGCSGSAMELNRSQYLWKFAAEFALGFPVKLETMQWMPIVYRRDIYEHTRSHIEARFKVPFEQYVLGCRSEFPQTFCEFNTLGGIVNEFHSGDYIWTRFEDEARPNYKIIQTWSHGGMDLPYHFPAAVGGLQTPAQLFQRLEIL